jgi:hypothetical protein
VRAPALVLVLVVAALAGCGGGDTRSTAADVRLGAIAKAPQSVLARVERASRKSATERCSLEDLRRSFRAASVPVEILSHGVGGVGRTFVEPPADDPPFFVLPSGATPMREIPEEVDVNLDGKRPWAWATVKHVDIGADTHVLRTVERIVAAGC